MDSELCLKQRKIKVTKARINILNILFKCEHAVSVEYLWEQCRMVEIGIDLSTIYRNLDLLVEKDLVNKFDLGDGKYNYVLKKEAHKHILQCSSCQKEIEIDCPMLHVEEIIRTKTGFTLMEHELKIKGICEECNKTSKKM